MKKNPSKLFTWKTFFQFTIAKLLIFSTAYATFDPLWATSIGGEGNDNGAKTTVTKSGFVISSFNFSSKSIKIGNNTYANTGTNNTSDIAFVKYDDFGQVVNSTTIGSGGNDVVTGITSDANENIYVSGYYSGITLSAGSLAALNQNTAGGSDDAFVLKLNSSLDPVSLKRFGTTYNERATSIIVNKNDGSFYVSFDFNGPSADFENGISVSNTNNFTYDISVVKFDENIIAKSAISGGGNGDDHSSSLVGEIVNGFSSNLWLQGSYNSPTFTMDGQMISNSGAAGTTDIYTLKINEAGKVSWINDLGGSGNDLIGKLCPSLDGTNSLHGCFSVASPGAVIGGVTIPSPPSGCFGGVYYKMDELGHFADVQYTKGNGSDLFQSLTIGLAGNVYLLASTQSNNFTFAGQSFSNTQNKEEIIEFSIGKGGSVVWEVPRHTSGNDITSKYLLKQLIGLNRIQNDGSSVNSSDNSIYLTGSFTDTSIPFGNITLYNDTTNHTFDVFLVELDDLSTGIHQDQDFQVKAGVFPNPFHDELTLKGNGAGGDVKIFDMTGKEILYQQTLQTATMLNTQFLSPGIYILSYKEGDRTTTIKLVKS